MVVIGRRAGDPDSAPTLARARHSRRAVWNPNSSTVALQQIQHPMLLVFSNNVFNRPCSILISSFVAFSQIPVILAFALPVDVARSIVIREVKLSPFSEAFTC